MVNLLGVVGQGFDNSLAERVVGVAGGRGGIDVGAAHAVGVVVIVRLFAAIVRCARDTIPGGVVGEFANAVWLAVGQPAVMLSFKKLASGAVPAGVYTELFTGSFNDAGF